MRLRVAIAGVALVGIAIAAYLTYVHYAHVAPVCVSGGCEKVQRSSYATLAGVPVAVLGLVGWTALLVSAMLRGASVALVGGALALAAFVFSAYLLWAQLGPIGAICQWCIANDVAITLVAGLCLVRVLAEPG